VATETQTHLALKRLAALWAHARGFRCIGFEVRAPHSNYRVDVACYRAYRASENRSPIAAVFECKQSREDFLRDSRQRQALSTLLADLQRRRIKLETLLQVHHPGLRRSDDFFPEWCTYDFSLLDHEGYRQLSRKIALLQRQLINNTKFESFSGYRLADLNYLVAQPGIVLPDEIPAGWGLLESVELNEVVERVPARLLPSNSRNIWLEHIARAATAFQLKQLNRVSGSSGLSGLSGLGRLGGLDEGQ
jgi:hypothetical protein